MKNNILLIIITLLTIGCNNQSKSEAEQAEKRHQEQILQKQTALELKEKELQLKQQELELLKKELEEKPKELKEIYRDVKSSVYLVYTQNEEGVSQGSAFLVSQSGIAISNYHVFENASAAILYNELGQEFLITEILEQNKDEDYIIFRVGEGMTNLQFLELSNKLPSIGEQCFAVGNPKGLTQTLSTGIVSALRDNNRLIQTTTEITNGSSGGPLFNSEGKVIGITTSGIGEANLNFAVNIERLQLDKYISESPTKEISNINKIDVKTIINTYYNILDKGEHHRLNKIYANTLKRFYSKFNINKNEAITDAKNYDSKFKITDKKTNVRWNTLEFSQSDNGDIVANYIMDYSISREEKNKPSNFVLYITIGINANGEIYSVYENILRKE